MDALLSGGGFANTTWYCENSIQFANPAQIRKTPSNSQTGRGFVKAPIALQTVGGFANTAKKSTSLIAKTFVSFIEENNMTVNEKADTAASYKKNGVCNCCQAVTKVYADELDIDEDTLMQMSSGFAAGMGCMEATCGAVLGACMVAGLKTKGSGTVKVSRALLAKFKEKCGATICKELKGAGTGKVLCECDDCVRNAVLSLEEVLGGQA
jgi:C_GCAxxG_C_C family probable redox protein